MRIMATVGLALALSTGCVVPSGFHAQQSLILRGVPVIPATIDGVQTLCVLDTGTPSLYLSTRFGGRPWTGLGDPDVYQIQSLVFANWEFAGGALTASDAIFEDWRQRLGVDEIDCWLGTGVMESMVVTVDYAGGFVELAGPQERPFTPFGVTNTVIDVPTIQADGRLLGVVDINDDLSAIALFDTGSSVINLLPEAYDDLAAPPPLSGESPPRGLLDAVAVAESRVEDVRFSVASDGRLQPLAAAAGLRVDGSVGASFLAAHAVVFDFPAGQISLRPYEESVRSAVLDELEQDIGY